MFLGAFHFNGDLDTIVRGYARLLETYRPDNLLLHVAIDRPNGITVYDACPSRADFEAFTGREGFRAAVASAGLPFPRIETLGELRTTRVLEGVAT